MPDVEVRLDLQFHADRAAFDLRLMLAHANQLLETTDRRIAASRDAINGSHALLKQIDDDPNLRRISGLL